jgi:hypothetical protein
MLLPATLTGRSDDTCVAMSGSADLNDGGGARERPGPKACADIVYGARVGDSSVSVSAFFCRKLTAKRSALRVVKSYGNAFPGATTTSYRHGLRVDFSVPPA